MIGLNIFVWIFIIAGTLAYHLSDSSDYLRDSMNVALSLMTLILTAGVTFHGIRVSETLFSVKGNENIRVLRWRIVATAAVCTICFTVRTVFWLWEPIAKKYSPHGTYPWFFYTLVELPPTLMLFQSLAPLAQPTHDETKRRRRIGVHEHA